jgi:hypothetical protein
MSKTAGKTGGKTQGKSQGKTKAKATAKSAGKRRRTGGNPGGDGSLSFDPPAQDDMSQQSAATSKHRVHDSINRVMAECDKVDAALVEFTRQDMPPLAIKDLKGAGGGAEATSGWAVVSADAQRPLTEWQAKAIVAAMQSPGAPVQVGIAAE